MKKIRNILIAATLCLAVFVLSSCSDDVSHAVESRISASQTQANAEYASVSFVADRSSESKALSSAISEGLSDFNGGEDLYWRYRANCLSKEGAAGTTTEEAPVKADGSAGLGRVEGFEVGTWRIMLFAYDDADYQRIRYLGFAEDCDLKQGDDNEITFGVTRARFPGQKGVLKIDSDNITFEGDTENAYELVASKVYSVDDATTVVATLTSETSSTELEPGFYTVTLIFNFEGYEYNAPVMSVGVYSNFTTVISGEMTGRQAKTVELSFVDIGNRTDYITNLATLNTIRHTYGAPTTLPDGAMLYYDFKGWSTNSNWANPVRILPASVYTDTTLYGKFTPTVYTISYDFNAKVNGVVDSTLDTTTATNNNPVKYDWTSSTITLSDADDVYRKGYAFAGWVSGTDTTSETIVEIPTNTSGSLTLTGTWREYTYNIEFDGNQTSVTSIDSGVTVEGSMEPITDLLYSEKVNLSSNGFTAAGFVFDGWSTKGAGIEDKAETDEVSGLSDVDGDTVTFYAKWVEAGDVHFETQHLFEKSDSTDASVSSNYETLDAYPNTERNDGKTATIRSAVNDKVSLTGFEYNSTLSASTVEGTISGNGDTVLKIYYNRVVRRLSLDFAGGKYDGAEDFTTNGDYKYGDALTSPTSSKMLRDGYTFAGWNVESGSIDASEMGIDNIVATAMWTPNTYTVTFTRGSAASSATDSGDADMADQSFTYDDDAKSLYSVSYKITGYNFDHWERTDKDETYEDAEAVQNLTTESNGVVTLAAVWEPRTYTVSYSAGTVSAFTTNTASGSTESTEMTYDVVDVLPSDNGFTLEGYHFTSWSTADDNGATGKKYATDTAFGENLSDQQPVTLYAVWEPNTFKVIYNSNTDVEKDRSETTGSMDNQDWTFDGTPKTLQDCAYEKEGYTFIGWNTKADGSGTMYTTTSTFGKGNNLSTGTDLTLYAIWEIDTFSITFNVVFDPVLDDADYGALWVDGTSHTDTTSFTKIAFGEVVTYTNISSGAFLKTTYSDFVTEMLIEAIPTLSTTDWAYSFVGWSNGSGDTLSELSTTGLTQDTVITATFKRVAQPRLNPIVTTPTKVIVDFKSANPTEYEGATYGSLSFEIGYGFEYLHEASIECALDGYELSGFYLDTGLTTQIAGANGWFVENVDGYVKNGKWIKIGGNIVIYAKWTATP